MRGPHSPTSSGGGADSYGYPPHQHNGYHMDDQMRGNMMREDDRGGQPWRRPDDGYPHGHSPNQAHWQDPSRYGYSAYLLVCLLVDYLTGSDRPNQVMQCTVGTPIHCDCN